MATNTLPPSPAKKTGDESRLRVRTISISLITSLLFAVFTVALYPIILATQTPNYYGLLVTGAISFTGLISGYLAWRGKTTVAGILLLSLFLLVTLSSPIIGEGQGLPIGFILAITGSTIAVNTLPRRLANWGSFYSIVTAVAVIVLDIFLPNFGLPSEPVYTYVASAIIGSVYVFFVARQFSSFALRSKLIISFIVVTIIPIVIIGVYNNYIGTKNLNDQSRAKLVDLSIIAAERYDGFIESKLNEITTEAHQDTLTKYILLFPIQRPGSPEEQAARATLVSFQTKDPIFITSYAILDMTGQNILDTNGQKSDQDESREIYYKNVLETETAFASNAVFINGNRPVMYFSAPIRAKSGSVIGILRAEYRGSILQKILFEVAPNDPNIVITVVDQSTYTRLAYNGNRDRLFKSYKDYSELEFAALQSEGKLPQGTRREILVGTDPIIVSGIDNLASEPYFNAYSGSLNADTINTGTPLKNQPWVALVRESTAASAAAITQQRDSTILISLGLTGIAVMLAFASSQTLTAPIVTLTGTAEKIASGDIQARASINTPDEIGALSSSFNRMTEQLNQSLANLEARVEERTADLQLARIQSEERALELQAVGEISKVIAGEQRLDTLLPLITRLVSERFNFYHSGIFLLDATEQYAVLQAANSTGGNRMLARGHKLEVGASGIVGYVTKFGTPRIALDVGLDAVFFNNPDLPTTRSEMALPLSARGRVIGALDVQSEEAGAFTEIDASNLGILADQIAIAIENARLFEQNQQALSEAQALYQRNLREGWMTFSREEPLIGYRQSLSGGKKLAAPIDSEEIREAINRGSMLVKNSDQTSEEPVIVVPIKLRGQVIGTLKVKAPVKDRDWTNDEVNLAESVTERLSIAIENARLIQESQKQALKEQAIGEITSKIGASINLRNVLQTAVEELGRSMPGSDVIIRLEGGETSERKDAS